MGTTYYPTVLARLTDRIDQVARFAAYPNGPDFGPSTFSAPHPMTYVSLIIRRSQGRVTTYHLHLTGLNITNQATPLSYTPGEIRCQIHYTVYLTFTISTISPKVVSSESKRFLSVSLKSTPQRHPLFSPR
jgi:hypothetical protein